MGQSSSSRMQKEHTRPSTDSGPTPKPIPPPPPFATAVPVVVGTQIPALDLTFTMDCTGSMGSYIRAAKENIEAIVKTLAEKEKFDLRFSLVAYRDHPPQDMTYVTMSFPFTDKLSDMQASLGKLSAQGGGDGPEAVAAGLKATLDQQWRPHAAKVCILIADAPPHGLGESGDGFPNGSPDGVDPLEVLDQMSMNGICIYSVGCQPALSHYRFATDFFIAAAERTNGQAVALGSAALLADVITGGAIEEMDLEKLSAQVQQQVHTLKASEPELEEAEVQQRVWRNLESAGLHTRQMKTSKLRPQHAGLISKAKTLNDARSNLTTVSPTDERSMEDAFSGAPRYGAPRKSKKMGASSAPSAPIYRSMHSRKSRDTKCRDTREDDDTDTMMEELSGRIEENVSLEDASVTLEQVSRIYGKCKNQGLI